MSKYKVAWSKTYHVSGEVEIEAVSEAHAVQRVEDEMGNGHNNEFNLTHEDLIIREYKSLGYELDRLSTSVETIEETLKAGIDLLNSKDDGSSDLR